ncbi:hypothetical protein [Hyphomicrobium sp.]|uniref:hypothetical protein n=1 Tax=Hyphomicrobium sp. TaxID=82 RepID=UPI001D626077|nr:hypothetical protein [Hyphomicrobium sp.]MBY0561413.1 hypothetical protein [Hyphomicrobium sp.]
MWQHKETIEGKSLDEIVEISAQPGLVKLRFGSENSYGLTLTLGAVHIESLIKKLASANRAAMFMLKDDIEAKQKSETTA